MRPILLVTAMLVIPSVASAQSQCAVMKAAEPFIQLAPPVDVTGRPVPLLRRPAPAMQPASDGTRPINQVAQPSADPSPSQVMTFPGQLNDVPVLRHIRNAGASLTELDTAHGCIRRPGCGGRADDGLDRRPAQGRGWQRFD